MTRLTKIVAAAFVALMLIGAAGCSADDDSAAGDVADSSGAMAQAEPPADDDAADEESEGADSSSAEITTAAIDATPRHVIYTVDLVVETDDITRAAARAAALAETAGGFVSHETTRGEDSATLTLRVPSGHHARLVADLEELGEVRERGRTAEDVTSEVVDVEARIESQQRSVERIRELLADAADLADIVRIEAELATREANLDSLLQRRETLASLTSMATITITFYHPADEAEPVATEQNLGFLAGLRGGWNAFTGVLAITATVVGAVLPFLLTGAILGVPSWMLLRRARRARPLAGPVPATAVGESGGER